MLTLRCAGCQRLAPFRLAPPTCICDWTNLIIRILSCALSPPVSNPRTVLRLAQDRLSLQEMTYAREYFVMMGRAFKDALLDHLPAWVPRPCVE